MINPQELKGTA